MRTNIVIDELMEKAMRIPGLSTKKEFVNKALHEFVQNSTRKSRKDLK